MQRAGPAVGAGNPEEGRRASTHTQPVQAGEGRGAARRGSPALQAAGFGGLSPTADF